MLSKSTFVPFLPPHPFFEGMFEVLSEKTPLALQGKWLDAGCGTGRHTRFLARLGLMVTGVDYSESELMEADRLTAGTPEASRVSFDRQSLSLLTYSDGYFDGVICNEVLHAVPRSEHQITLASLQRVTKPGGIHLVTGYVTERSRGHSNHLYPYELRNFYIKAGWLIVSEFHGKPHAEVCGNRVVQRAQSGVIALRP
ncbi:MAG: class I SAM-dependent methyltransferase [Candidatus Saccharimonadales bacterium]